MAARKDERALISRSQLEEAQAELQQRDLIAGAVNAIASGKGKHVRIAVDGPAPLKEIVLTLRSPSALARVAEMLKEELSASDAHLAALGVKP